MCSRPHPMGRAVPGIVKHNDESLVNMGHLANMARNRLRASSASPTTLRVSGSFKPKNRIGLTWINFA